VIDPVWIERCARSPDWGTDDAAGDGREWRFQTNFEFGNRVLRVVCRKSDMEIRITTMLFDRRAQ